MKAVFQVLSFDVLSKLILGVLGIALIRYMPAAEYAEYTFALSLAAFATQSIAATFNRVYVLSAQDTNGRNNEWPAVGLQAFLIVILTILGSPLISSLGSSYWLVAALIVANCASDFAKTYYQRDLKFLRFSLIELSRAAVFFAGVAVLISVSGASISSDAIIGVQATSLMLVGWLALKGRVGAWKATNLRGVANYARGLINGGYSYLFAYFFAVSVFTQTDIFMLRIVGDETMMATYGSAFRYYSILSLALGAVHTVLLPRIAGSMGRADLQLIFTKYRRILVVFALATAIAGGLAHWAIPWVDAGKYPDAVVTFRILCVSAVISLAFSPHVNLVMRFERFRFLLVLILLALCFHILMCAILIPRLGPAGVAIATLVASAMVNFSIYLRSRKLMDIPNNLLEPESQ
jgi:O-antigen/teichoic acid export membrane protein